MLRVIFFGLFTFAVLSSTAQVQTQVIGDSVFVHSNTSTGELILQNSTDTVNGFLHNKGGGRTEFRRVLVKINDSIYVIGVDTLNIHSQGGGGTVLNVATGYGLTGGPITTTGTIIVDSATLHSKFLGKADSTIYYPYASNPKNYLTSSNGWSTTGNSGTTAGTNFLGTTDNKELQFKVNNGFAGKIGIGSFSYTSFGQGAVPTTSTGIHNNGFGYLALSALTSGGQNTSIGDESSIFESQGNFNVAVGVASLAGDTASSANVAIGWEAMARNPVTTKSKWGSYNAAVGFQSLYNMPTDSFSIGLGYRSGTATAGSHTFFVSDSTTHLYMKLDNVTGTAPGPIGKDASGFWHVYEAPIYGTATLAAGTVTVSTALVKTGAKIFVSVNTPGGTQGFLSAPAANIVNSTSFKINSTSATETSTVNWQIIN